MPGIFCFHYKFQNMLTSQTVLLPKRNKYTLIKIQTLIIEDAKTQEVAYFFSTKKRHLKL